MNFLHSLSMAGERLSRARSQLGISNPRGVIIVIIIIIIIIIIIMLITIRQYKKG